MQRWSALWWAYRYILLLVFLIILGTTGYVYTAVPTAFVPQEGPGILPGDRTDAARSLAGIHQ